MTSWLINKRITVTGGAGFLGTYVVNRLEEIGCRNIFVPRSKIGERVKVRIRSVADKFAVAERIA